LLLELGHPRLGPRGRRQPHSLLHGEVGIDVGGGDPGGVGDTTVGEVIANLGDVALGLSLGCVVKAAQLKIR
jgi:hypothetical protein